MPLPILLLLHLKSQSRTLNPVRFAHINVRMPVYVDLERRTSVGSGVRFAIGRRRRLDGLTDGRTDSALAGTVANQYCDHFHRAHVL